MQSTGNELAHYGVLGMKWGQRRFQNSDGSLTAAGKEHYQYQSHATKKYTRKAARAARKGNVEKAEKYSNRAKRSAELDRREEEGARHVSTGKAIATRLLLGGDMSKAYHQHLAMMGTSVNKATKGQKATARIMSYYGGTTYSRLMKAAYIRQGENGRLGRYGRKMIEGNKQSSNAIDYAANAFKARRKLQRMQKYSHAPRTGRGALGGRW